MILLLCFVACFGMDILIIFCCRGRDGGSKLILNCTAGSTTRSSPVVALVLMVHVLVVLTTTTLHSMHFSIVQQSFPSTWHAGYSSLVKIIARKTTIDNKVW